jgi:hypothetical protein
MFGTYFSATIFLPESGLPVLARLDATSQASNAEQADGANRRQPLGFRESCGESGVFASRRR